MKNVFLSMALLLFAVFVLPCQAQFSISGKVTNEKGESLTYASVFLVNAQIGTVTEEDGSYIIDNVPEGSYILKTTFLGYEYSEQAIEVSQNMIIDIVLKGSLFKIEDITIRGIQAKDNDPVVRSDLNNEQIENANLGQDVPYIMKWMPSITVTSDAGAGIGYTGIRVRGSDASRTNVTINGVPLNDSESHGTYWVDLPDVLSSTEDIQIQRGVGVSTNGTSAFGATVHLNTKKSSLKPYATIDGSVGSYGTYKASAQAGTGLMNNKFSIDARYSQIKSNGYIDRARAAMTSFYASVARVSNKQSLRFNLLSGHEITYQAWNGLPYQYRTTQRTYNTAGTDKPGEPYNNEVDNYRQTHMQLMYDRMLSNSTKFNIVLHYTKGKGFYENYKGKQDLNKYAIVNNDGKKYDVVRRKWLDNDFVGVVFDTEIQLPKVTTIIGGSINYYLGRHFGESTWNELNGSYDPIEFYRNNATKEEASLYTRFNGSFSKKLVPFVDLQVRYLTYQYEGPKSDGTVGQNSDNLLFFNPKVGLSYMPSVHHKIFAYYGMANREPSRNEYVKSTPETRPKHETLHDIEIGYNFEVPNYLVKLNFFNMYYKNQLVPTGQLNEVGEYNRVNVDQSFRRGVELETQISLLKYIHIGYAGSISRNKIKAFDEYVDNWKTWEQEVIAHKNTDIAFSPNMVHAFRLGTAWKPSRHHKIQATFSHKIVGKQYLDNTSSAFSSIPKFDFSDFQLIYDFNKGIFKGVTLNFMLNNVFNKKYYNYGWIYRYKTDVDPTSSDPYSRPELDGVYNQTGLYTQATRNWLLGLKLKF